MGRFEEAAAAIAKKHPITKASLEMLEMPSFTQDGKRDKTAPARKEAPTNTGEWCHVRSMTVL